MNKTQLEANRQERQSKVFAAVLDQLEEYMVAEAWENSSNIDESIRNARATVQEYRQRYDEARLGPH